MGVVTAADWETFLRDYPRAHLLQSAGWGELKSHFGWTPVYLQIGQCGAAVLFRKLPLGLSIAYIPKGPLGADWRPLWPLLQQVCRQRRSIFLRIEPDAWEDQFVDLENRFPPGFRPSQPVQPQRTILINLAGSEEDWLARMKQKTRYNIHLAQRKGVTVRFSDDLETFHRLMQFTGQRDGFGVHTAEYYRRAFQIFQPRGQCALLSAEFEGRVLAMLMAFCSGPRAWYFYGASSDEERNRMPTYLLQWEAMRWAALQGCVEYDLWGIPDFDEQRLESEFASRSEGLWGVYRFKRGFGGELKRSAGAWEQVYNPPLYALYRWYSGRRSEEAA